jgi:hypothetical protein
VEKAPDFKRKSCIYNAVFLGLVITLSQILFACLLTDAKHPLEAYLKLCMWDSGWYQHIIEHGYRSTIPPVAQNQALSNVAFLPGYPILAGAIASIFHLPTPSALLLAAQLACWGFWTYVFLFFQRWQVSTKLAFGGAIAILVHPAAFYLVVGYSESLFLMMLLGFLYWTASAGRYSWLLAALHGFVMTATRIVGLPLAIYPALHFWLFSMKNQSEKLWQESSKYLAISMISALGCILFFAFCYFKFGVWNLYMKTQAVGWGIKPDYLAILQPKSYLTFFNSSDFVGFINGVSVPITMAYFAVLGLIELKVARLFQNKSWQQRTGFYFCGWFMFYLSVCGLSNINMNSMIRYTFCTYIVLVMASVHLLSTTQFLTRLDKRWMTYSLLFVAACSFVIQNKLLVMFTNNKWVA